MAQKNSWARSIPDQDKDSCQYFYDTQIGEFVYYEPSGQHSREPWMSQWSPNAAQIPSSIASSNPRSPYAYYQTPTSGFSGPNIHFAPTPNYNNASFNRPLSFSSNASASWHSSLAMRPSNRETKESTADPFPTTPPESSRTNMDETRHHPSPAQWIPGQRLSGGESNLTGAEASGKPFSPGKPLESEGKHLLYDHFKKVEKPRKFFCTGKVFLILWSEPGGDTSQSLTTGKAWTKNNYGEWVFSKVRRFVVVNEGDRACTAIPVMTYNGQGVAKKGVKKSDHAIIFTGKQPPSPTENELPAAGEAGLREHAIRVDSDQRGEKLDAMSRVDFAKPQSVQHYCKVKSFGKVNRDSLAWLIYQFRAVTYGEASTPALPPILTTSQYIGQDSTVVDPLLAQPKFRAIYDALIALNHTPEQAALILQSSATITKMQSVDATEEEEEAQDLTEVDYSDEGNGS